jgi:FkbM family methyltransferase
MSWIVTGIDRFEPPVEIRGYVDSPSVGVAVPGWLSAAGWCFSVDGSPVTVEMFAGEQCLGTLLGRMPRQDVADAFAPRGVAHSLAMYAGFSGDLPVRDVIAMLETSGQSYVQLHIRARTAHASAVLCTLDLGVSDEVEFVEETSQAGEVTELQHILPANVPRLVVDIGAHDGRFLSNSYSYIASGWRGVLIEPMPEVFQRLVANHQRHPHALCVNVACGATSAVAKLYVGADGDLGQNSTLSTDDNEWMRAQRTSRSIDVRVEPISQVLADAGILGDIGLLLVDCEGMDLEALQGLDPSVHRPWVVVTEQYAQNPAKETAKAALLRSWGMTFRATVGCNDIWVHPEVVPSA